MGFKDYYKTLLGRNVYNQNLRQYVYKPYTNGKYYSDCSSSICATYQKCGIDVGLLNTAGMYRNGVEVDVEIKDGHIVSGFEKLRVGDALLFRGYPYENADRPLGIGHVEAIYEIGKDELLTTICGHGSGNPSLKNMHAYLSSRQSQFLQNGKTKGLVCVVRFIKDDVYHKDDVVSASEYVTESGSYKCEATLRITSEELTIRNKPDFSVRKRWFKTDRGYISAYKVEGWVLDDYGWWYVEDDFKYPTSEFKTIKGIDYAFDKNGYMLEPDRITKDGGILY